jgi:hypothetical protein
LQTLHLEVEGACIVISGMKFIGHFIHLVELVIKSTLIVCHDLLEVSLGWDIPRLYVVRRTANIEDAHIAAFLHRCHIPVLKGIGLHGTQTSSIVDIIRLLQEHSYLSTLTLQPLEEYVVLILPHATAKSLVMGLMVFRPRRVHHLLTRVSKHAFSSLVSSTCCREALKHGKFYNGVLQVMISTPLYTFLLQYAA